MKSIATIILMLGIFQTLDAQDVVNIYSARHYDTDDKLYDQFEKKTGIKVQIIEGSSDALLQRIAREGKRSPADIFITVDAARLHKAVEQGVFQTVESEVLDKSIPENLRHPNGLWFGLTKRARIIFVSRERIKEGEISSYEDLVKPELKGKILIRSSTNVYNQSLVGAMIEKHGEVDAEKWCRAIVANMARPPQGGDRDQIKAVAAGEGDIAVANSYYFARMLKGTDEEREAAKKVRAVFPNQDGGGAHVNISGAGVVSNAPNKENAVKLLEFLVSQEAQAIFAAGNNEYPVVEGTPTVQVLKDLGKFKEDVLNPAVIGENTPRAIRIMDRVGWR